MSQANVEIVRALYEYFNRTGGPNLDVFAADFEWHARADFPDAGTHTGHEGLLGLIAKWDAAFDHLRLEADELIDAGDHVVVLARIRGQIRGTAQKVELPEVQVWRMRDGQAVEVRAYLTRAEALQAVGIAQ
ncbi:MAG TPA: nuclear transport factor 2 family protein [Solirubrobacteraceae bacterium]|jgi:ketosteroid isomerase-like protein|nr:nuclear transport factor 2 family protein [Solirubrobacteraceae bacterium]